MMLHESCCHGASITTCTSAAHAENRTLHLPRWKGRHRRLFSWSSAYLMWRICLLRLWLATYRPHAAQIRQDLPGLEFCTPAVCNAYCRDRLLLIMLRVIGNCCGTKLTLHCCASGNTVKRRATELIGLTSGSPRGSARRLETLVSSLARADIPQVDLTYPCPGGLDLALSPRQIRPTYTHSLMRPTT